MKTKPFLLATAGSTVDGRTIDDKMLREMASSYNPETYAARINIEHIRGISGEKPFQAYGDILEVSTGEVDVDFNGKTEKRLGLFGVLDVSDNAKALNDAGQKVYPSIEIEPNFAGKGFAYLMGCALTDSPASIATERLKFNRARPGVLAVNGEQAAALEFADEEKATEEAAGAVKGFFAKMTELLSGTAPPPPVKQDPVPPQPGNTDGAILTAFAAEFAKVGDVLAGALEKQGTAFNAKVDQLSSELTALKQQVDNTTDPNHRSRPPANGQGGQTDYSKVF